MKKDTLILDVGGTIFIKDDTGHGIVNPAITYLVKNINPAVRIVILSDTDLFDVPKLLSDFIPELHYEYLFYKGQDPWIDKTTPETYMRVCEIIKTSPEKCIFIDNDAIFKKAANKAGILTYGIDQSEIEQVIAEFII